MFEEETAAICEFCDCVFSRAALNEHRHTCLFSPVNSSNYIPLPKKENTHKKKTSRRSKVVSDDNYIFEDKPTLTDDVEDFFFQTQRKQQKEVPEVTNQKPQSQQYTVELISHKPTPHTKFKSVKQTKKEERRAEEIKIRQAKKQLSMEKIQQEKEKKYQELRVKKEEKRRNKTNERKTNESANPSELKNQFQELKKRNFSLPDEPIHVSQNGTPQEVLLTKMLPSETHIKIIPNKTPEETQNKTPEEIQNETSQEIRINSAPNETLTKSTQDKAIKPFRNQDKLISTSNESNSPATDDTESKGRAFEEREKQIDKQEKWMVKQSKTVSRKKPFKSQFIKSYHNHGPQPQNKREKNFLNISSDSEFPEKKNLIKRTRQNYKRSNECDKQIPNKNAKQKGKQNNQNLQKLVDLANSR